MNSPIIKVVIDPDYVRQLAEAEIKRQMKDLSPGIWWDMKRLEVETCRKRDWLLANILLNPAFKKEMRSCSNGCEGGRWMFRASEMIRFLDMNFESLNKSPSKLIR
ncbi:DUF771 domain-containing protein [Paenibacillus wynnii]|uniref:DUF771 domain-containing protein n=1 Tax=Paenibacillus wynnii TaxID=268407 RepID=A0A098MDD1_9BACL|nr:DUF771 domain-containing protein [Paenibacillus wynnii]KGE20580.1 hypothetical protein PWYN_15425 [Paenibacillus wynnii]